MGDSMNGFGLSWEQLLIAGVAFAVLIAVIVAAFRGSGRGKRDRPDDGAHAFAGERRAPREPPGFAAASAGGRAEPSLGRAAAPTPPPRPQPAPVRSEPAPRPEPVPRSEPVPRRTESPPPIRSKPPAPLTMEPESKPDPVPSFLVPREPAAKESAAPPSPAVAEPDPALEDLKSEVEELRQANAILKRRVEETERTLNDMQTEIQAKFSNLERFAERVEPGAKPTPLRPPPPQRLARSAEAPPDRENDLERARRAIELLSRKDEDTP